MNTKISRASSIAKTVQDMDLTLFSMLPILDLFYEGIIIANKEGRVVYMNQTQADLDDLDINLVKGRKVTEIYRVDDGISPTMQCLRTGKAIENLACFYRTHLGKMINSIHNVYPLFHNREICGTICFIREYNSMDKTVEYANSQETKRDLQSFNLSNHHRERLNIGNGTRFTFDDLIGNDERFIQAVHSASMACNTPSSIMLYGETGTGKELFAQSIHNKSFRSKKRFVAVNCAAIPENLLEGILFGTSKGAFTGSIDKEGLFEKASGGTLLLDEINSMPIGLQAKLLRTLQEKKYAGSVP
ncbi:RocR (fragment) [Desulfamplus magnetovallimortis]|uniref:RocR n=1 Tax=Desulfamplus magnetovallimortis TaxID=1246637 RepID=A0A1W1HCQ5_9BACT